MYESDQGIEELIARRGSEYVSLEWVGHQLRAFVDQDPSLEGVIGRLATWLARDDIDE